MYLLCPIPFGATADIIVPRRGTANSLLQGGGRKVGFPPIFPTTNHSPISFFDFNLENIIIFLKSNACLKNRTNVLFGFVFSILRL